MKPKLFQDIANKAARKATEQLHENLQGIAQEMAGDQAQWLDARMREILKPDIYEKAIRGDCEREVNEYFEKNKIKLTFIPDSMRIRIDVAGQQYAEFVPRFTIDGEPIEWTPQSAFRTENN